MRPLPTAPPACGGIGRPHPAAAPCPLPPDADPHGLLLYALGPYGIKKKDWLLGVYCNYLFDLLMLDRYPMTVFVHIPKSSRLFCSPSPRGGLGHIGHFNPMTGCKKLMQAKNIFTGRGVSGGGGPHPPPKYRRSSCGKSENRLYRLGGRVVAALNSPGR